MTPVLAVAHMTMLELRRSRLRWGLLVLLLFAASCLFIASGGWGTASSSSHGPIGGTGGGAMVRDGTKPELFRLITALVEGMLVLLTLLTSAATVDDDIEAGTMLVLAVRPMARAGIIAGKFIGIILTQFMVVGIWGVVVGGIESIKADDIAPFTPMILAMLQSMPLLMLAAAIGLAMSVVCPARLAGLLATGLFVFAAIVPNVSTRLPALEAAVPSGSLAQLGVHGEIELGAGLLLAGCVAIVAWVGLAAILLEWRRDLT